MTQILVSRFSPARLFLALVLGFTVGAVSFSANATEPLLIDEVTEATDFARTKAILNLNPGDEITIRANTTTTVTCAMGSTLPNCKSAIASYESRYQTCKRSYPASTCFNNEWPTFKTRNPECITEAFDACVRTCGESYPGSTCYNNCR